MKSIISILLSFICAYGLTISLNSAKQSGLPYSTLHLVAKKPILCETKKEAFGKQSYLCMFHGELKNQVKNQNTPQVDMAFISKKDKFYIYIKPKKFSKMINVDAKLYEHETIPLPTDKPAKHWTVLIYEKMPFKKQKNDSESINFPITFLKDKYPSVGALDLNSKPIDYAKSADMDLYISLKKDYEKKRYQNALRKVDKIVKKYPQSIFMSDALLYRLKLIDKMLDLDMNVGEENLDRTDEANEAKKWLKTFPGESSTSEVLMLLVKSYLEMGFGKEANYYLDSLITQFPNDKYTQQAILVYANSLFNKSMKGEAISLAQKVLYLTKNVQTASDAAFKLARWSLDVKESQKAVEYLNKVLKANEPFIYKDKELAYKFAKNLAQKGEFKSAVTVAKGLLKNMRKINVDYEGVLKDIGIWSVEVGDIKSAELYLKRYKKEYRDGEFDEQVQEALDKLFFHNKDKNSTKLLAYYDKLIQKYKNDVGERALKEKVNLLISDKKFQEAIALKDELMQRIDKKEAQDLIFNVREQGLEYALMRDDCTNVAQYLKDDEKLLYTVKNKLKSFECLMRTKYYDIAYKEALKESKNEDLSHKLLWLLNLQSAVYSQNKWQKSIEIAKDVENLGNVLGDKRANFGLYDRFLALTHLNRYEEAVDICKKIEQNMPNQFRNVEIYNRMMLMAKDRGDDMLAIAYAKKAFELQEANNNFVLTPNLEYNYISSLQNMGEFQRAKDVALSLLKRKLSKNDLARSFYVIAQAYAKDKDRVKAKEYFKKCVANDEQSSWGKICQDNLSLYDENSIK